MPPDTRRHASFRTASARPISVALRFPTYNPQAVAENGQGRKEITCLIVDDHEVVREGLRLSLSRAPHIRVVGEASDGSTAIDKVVAGEGFVDPALMPAFLGDARDDMLTGREREILQLLADGMSNADVASKLFISQETVKSHVRHILSKLEADTRTHAVAIALREAIID